MILNFSKAPLDHLLGLFRPFNVGRTISAHVNDGLTGAGKIDPLGEVPTGVLGL